MDKITTNSGERDRTVSSVFGKNPFLLSSVSGVQDDRTMVVLITNESPLERPEIQYYQEPNWPELREKLSRVLYPEYSAELNEGKTPQEGSGTGTSEGDPETVPTGPKIPGNVEYSFLRKNGQILLIGCVFVVLVVVLCIQWFT